MKHGRPQAKDITDATMLDVVRATRGQHGVPEWATLGDIQAAMPTYPPKVVTTKLASMVRRGVIYGCACGCRGDFGIPAETDPQACPHGQHSEATTRWTIKAKAAPRPHARGSGGFGLCCGGKFGWFQDGSLRCPGCADATAATGSGYDATATTTPTTHQGVTVGHNATATAATTTAPTCCENAPTIRKNSP